MPPRLALAEQAVDVLAACIDTFGRCISNTASLTKQMAILDPVNDHAFMLPVCCPAMAVLLLCSTASVLLRTYDGGRRRRLAA